MNSASGKLNSNVKGYLSRCVGVGCGCPFPKTLNWKEDFVVSENILINKFTLSERGRSFLLLCEAGVMTADRTVHGVINFIDTTVKQNVVICKGLCGGCLSEFVYRLEIQPFMLHGIFRPSFVNCCPSNLISGSSLPPPSLCEQMYTIQCERGGGGMGFWASGRLKFYEKLKVRKWNKFFIICRKVPLQVNFFRWQQIAMPSMSLRNVFRFREECKLESVTK